MDGKRKRPSPNWVGRVDTEVILETCFPNWTTLEHFHITFFTVKIQALSMFSTAGNSDLLEA
jgi:hypothetical protein